MDNPLETEISRKRSPANELTKLAGQPMETKNSKKQALAIELTTLANELLKESWKNSKGPTVPTPGTLIATYVRLKNDACYQTILGLVHCLVWADFATFV